MSKKVLGFKNTGIVYHNSLGAWLVKESDIVSVRLKSESVSIDWLEKYCEKHEIKEGFGMMPFVPSHDLLTEAKKEVKK